jgi:DNA-binding IclR family transcriptional regulator
MDTGSQSVARIAQILKLLCANRDNGMRFVDVAAECNLERPTAHRYLRSMLAQGLAHQDGQSKRYFLGAMLLELGQAASRHFDLRSICLPSLRRLAAETGDSAFLFVRNDCDALCLERVQGSYHIQTPVVAVGSRQPLGVNAGGLAILFTLTDREVEQIVDSNADQFARFGHLTVAQLHKLVKEARQRRYAVIGERAAPGITAVGLPILGETGLPIAAFTVATTSDRMTGERQEKVAPMLRREARNASGLLRIRS